MQCLATQALSLFQLSQSAMQLRHKIGIVTAKSLTGEFLT